MVARLAIDKDFLDDYSRLEKSVQVAVKAAMEKFSEHTHAGIHLETWVPHNSAWLEPRIAV